MSSSCPSSPTSRSPVSLSYSNRPRKRLSSADNQKNINTSPANTDSSQTTKAPSPIQIIQHHVIKGRISPIMVARKIFTAHQDTASQQLMGNRNPTHSVSCPSSPTLSPSAIPVGPSSSAPASTSISTRTARPSFARRTSAPSLLVSALVASHANSREKLSQDAGGQKSTEQEKSLPCSPRRPIESVPTISVTAVVENSPEATTTNDGGDKGDTLVKKSCGAPPLRPALKHSTSDPQGSSVRRKSVQFEIKFERIRLFLRAETPHAVTLSPTSWGPKPKKDTGSIVLPNFPPLTTCYHSKPVSMESLSLSSDGTYIHGLVQVQNLAYEKIVRARYSFDCWNTAHETAARYKEPIIPSDSNHRGLDRFEFSIPIPHRLDSADDAADLWRTMYMAVQYQVDGAQFWDSNSGQNYQINIRQPPPQYFEEDEDVDQGIFHLSDLSIADDDSQENSPDLSSSPRKMMGGKPLSVPVSSSDFGYFAPKSPLSAISSTGTIPLRTVKKNLGNRYDFGASLAATVRPRSSPPSFSNPLYHRPSSPLSFSSYSSSKASSTPSSQIPTSSPKTSLSSKPYSSPLPVTSPSPRPPASFPFMSSSSVEAPISSTPWEERARTAAVTYRRPSSPSCDFSSNSLASYDSSSFPGIPSAWTSYSPSGASLFDAKYPGSVNSLSSSPTQPYHQPYSPLSSSPYSASPPATAIWG